MVLNITPEDFQRMKMAVLEGDGKEAVKLLKAFIKQLDQQAHSGMKSHLG
jgi:hypothetical protein